MTNQQASAVVNAMRDVRTFWISFVHHDGHDGFKGVCVVDVSREKAMQARSWGAAPNQERPVSEPETGHWYTAALWEAYDHNCNPGGQARIEEIPTTDDYPRNVLMDKAYLLEHGYIKGDTSSH